MTTIQNRFLEMSSRGETGFIPYITYCDPDAAFSRELIRELGATGADFIEVGVPFSEPVADGPTIQNAMQRSLANDISLNNVLDGIAEIRAGGLQTPLILFSYYNPIRRLGLEEFSGRAEEVGVSGVLIVDLPVEESREYRQTLARHRIDTVFLAAPTTTDERLKTIDTMSSGFVYYVSRAGVTGAREDLPEEIRKELQRVRARVQKPLAVGFGISNPVQAEKLRDLTDGIVVGSALVRLIESAKNRTAALREILRLTEGFIRTLHGNRT